MADASKENLTAAWKQWLQEAVQETGTIPPGNAQVGCRARWRCACSKRAFAASEIDSQMAVAGTDWPLDAADAAHPQLSQALQ